MNRPTKEQIAEARLVAAEVVAADNVTVASPAMIKSAMRTLLAVTAEPNEQALNAEALRLANVLRYDVLENNPKYAAMFCTGYVSGAQREGAQ